MKKRKMTPEQRALHNARMKRYQQKLRDIQRMPVTKAKQSVVELAKVLKKLADHCEAGDL